MNLVDFICESNNSVSTESLILLLIKFLKGFNIDNFIMCAMPYFSVNEEKIPIIILNHPEGEFDLKNYSKSINYNQVYQKALKAKKLFTWDIINTGSLTGRIIDEKSGSMICRGIYVPVIQSTGKTIGMVFIGSKKEVIYDKDTISFIHVASHHFFMVYSRINSITDSGHDEINLTNREHDVLYWIALGKTKSETAKILSISESCVKRHCENIFIKLGVNNLPSAVAKAIKMSLL